MTFTEIEWKASHIYSIWQTVQVRRKTTVDKNYDQLSLRAKNMFRELAVAGIDAIDKAWSCVAKKRRRQYQGYKSPYKNLGLHPLRSLREK